MAGSLQLLVGVLSIPSGPKVDATGGTITTVGGYKIHTFNTSGTFTVIAGGDVEYLVIAGGGSGALSSGGGAGAGGYRSSVVGESSGGGASAESVLAVVPGSYTITVGAGGAGLVGFQPGGAPCWGLNGSDSSIGTAVVSTGGGGGGTEWYSPYNSGQPGGSGGGSTFQVTGAPSAGAGTANQGYPGGRENTGGVTGTGGGGGAGGTGGNSGASNGGNGGAGVTSAISGSPVGRAGGGGGIGFYGGSSSIRGVATDGGGDGGWNWQANKPINSGQPGTVNTGGGGGGGTRQDCDSGAGGSGVVIIRYKA